MDSLGSELFWEELADNQVWRCWKGVNLTLQQQIEVCGANEKSAILKEIVSKLCLGRVVDGILNLIVLTVHHEIFNIGHNPN